MEVRSMHKQVNYRFIEQFPPQTDRLMGAFVIMDGADLVADFYITAMFAFPCLRLYNVTASFSVRDMLG